MVIKFVNVKVNIKYFKHVVRDKNYKYMIKYNLYSFDKGAAGMILCGSKLRKG